MRKIIFFILLILTVFSSTAMSITAVDWFNNAQSLWDEDGGKFADSRKAIGYLNNAIKLQPDYASAYNSRGNAYVDLGQYQRAIDDYNQAIGLQPNHAYAYINRADAYYGLGQYQRAVEDCNEAIRLNPDMAIAYSNRGKAYAKLKKYPSAIKDFNEAIRLKPDNVNAYNNRGFTYLLQGNNNLGCLDAQKACELGICKVLEWAKKKGKCLPEKSLKQEKDEVKISPMDTSIPKSPKKQSPLPVENLRPSPAKEQNYMEIKGLKGIKLINGDIIEGQIISLNSEVVKIRIKDGTILSYSFNKEVHGFIK